MAPMSSSSIRAREDAITLEVLSEIEARGDLSQRRLAARLGIALGLTNSYVKRCVRKGLVKVRQIPANRYFYYLTPKGFAEKSRLTGQYLAVSFEFYGTASNSVVSVFSICRQHGVHRIGLAGRSEFAEIATLRAPDFQLEVVGTFDPTAKPGNFIGRPLWDSLDDVPAVDAWVVTALVEAATMYGVVVERFGAEKVYAPGILRLGAAATKLRA